MLRAILFAFTIQCAMIGLSAVLIIVGTWYDWPIAERIWDMLP